MRTTRVITAVLVAGSASFGFLPLAHAETLSVAPGAEAWYQPNPTCGSPLGCIGLGDLPVQPPLTIPLSPYPVGSLHVAVDAGKETARTYLSFSLPLFDATLTAATLDIPLDVSPADGSLTPEDAQISVCTFQGSVTQASGSIAQPPTASCATSAKATYVPTPAPHLHADLAPLLSPLSYGAGLVLLPDALSTAPTDAWRVVFSAHDRADAAKTPPAALAVTLAPIETPAPSEGPTVPQATVVPPALGPVSVPAPALAAPMSPPTVAGPTLPAPMQAVPQARTVTVGYQYPIVWLLPLAFLLVVPLVARALTRDLTPAISPGS